MKTQFLTAGVFAAAMLMTTAASAEIIKAEVISTDVSSQSIYLKVAEGKKAGLKTDEKISATITDDTQFEGALFKDFRAGDVLLLDIFKGASRELWIVRRVQIDKINIRNVRETVQAAN